MECQWQRSPPTRIIQSETVTEGSSQIYKVTQTHTGIQLHMEIQIQKGNSFGPFVICPRMTLKNTQSDIEEHLDGYVSKEEYVD